MANVKKRLPWVVILICSIIIVLIIFVLMSNRNHPQYLLNSTVPLHDSITYLSVQQGQGFGRQDVTHYIDRDELLYLLAETQMWRDNNAWVGTSEAEWVISISQTGNQFHRSINIVLGEAHGMMTERGFRLYFFRLSNGDEIIEALERMLTE